MGLPDFPVAAVFLREDGSYVVLGDEVLPVTNHIGEDGNTCGWEDAYAVVAGPSKDGFWLTIEVSDDDAPSWQ